MINFDGEVKEGSQAEQLSDSDEVPVGEDDSNQDYSSVHDEANGQAI